MNKFKLTALSAAFCLAMSTGAIAGTMSKSDYKNAKADIAAAFVADKVACKPLTANALDICIVAATGRQKVASAELEAKNAPSDKLRYNVRLAKADAAYASANEKCDDLTGNAKDVCRKEATAMHVTAKADAKVAGKTADANATAREKTDAANASARATTTEARKDAAVVKNDAAYAVAKEKCDAFKGDVKDNCVKDAKVRYGQS